MNRLTMAEEIARRVPMLAQRDKDEWKHAEQLRAEFVVDYPPKRIPNLVLDDYVIGKGPDHRSFCYRLEREMDSLGRILGATAFKFGIYFGHTKSDATNCYRFALHWGSNPDEAFAAVKQAIVDLLQAAAKGDSAAIAANALSPMFKGKILFIYYPDQFAPIYSEEHLHHFIAELDLSGSFECGADMQRALMDYRATWPELAAQPAALYMRLLYDLFDYPPQEKAGSVANPRTPVLNEAVAGATFIASMPPSSAPAAALTAAKGKTDHEARHRSLKRIGDRGEALVLALERKRLIAAGKPQLAKKIVHVAERNDSAGYDVLSFDEDGTERPIEVKATGAPNLDLGFYVTANELTKASKLPNYHVYLVFRTMSKNPRVLPLKGLTLNGPDFEMQPIVFHVTTRRG
jgi:hypothetical protein